MVYGRSRIPKVSFHRQTDSERPPMRNIIHLMFLAIAPLLFLLATGIPANAQGPVRPLKEKIQSGSYLFAARGCSTCHSVKGKGGKVGPDLTRVTTWASPLLGAAVMWNHVPLMEKAQKERGLSWPDFTEEEIGDIFEYLHSLSPRGGSIHSFKGNPLEGEARFTGTCQRCHGAPFKGGRMGPDLGEKAAEIKNDAEFATRMLSHSHKMAPYARRMKIPWPQLTGSEISGIFLYLKSLSPPPK